MVLSLVKISLDMPNLPQGNYLVKVTIECAAKTIKVVKINVFIILLILTL